MKKGQKKPTALTKKENERVKLQREIQDDKIIELHFQKQSLREIGKKLKLSHATVKQRLDKILNKIGSANEATVEAKRKVKIRERELLIKKAWSFINKPKAQLAFKYMEVIHKVTQEIERLEGLHREVKSANDSSTFEDTVEKAWKDRE